MKLQLKKYNETCYWCDAVIGMGDSYKESDLIPYLEINDEKKKIAIEYAQKMGLIISLINEEGISYTTDGHAREKLKWEEIFKEIENLKINK